MKLADLIIADAHGRGLRHFFGIPGGGAPLDLMDAGRRRGVQFVNVAHESSAAIAAAYYGAMKGTAGLALSVKGVGAGNLVGGATNVHFERMPVVCLCETSPASFKQRNLVQHVKHDEMFKGVVKFEATLEPQSAAATLRRAESIATDGRPGPVHLDLASDLGTAESGDIAPRLSRPTALVAGQASVAEFKGILGRARKPVVIAGGDTIRGGAIRELRSFVDAIGGAVLVTMEARGAFPESDLRWAGVLVGTYGPNVIETEIMAQADLVILIGVDSMMAHAPWKSGLKVIELAALAEYESLAPEPAVRVVSNLKAVLAELSTMRQDGFATAEVQATRKKVLANFRRPSAAVLAAHDVVSIVRTSLPSDGVLISETGAFVTLIEHLWPVETPGTFMGTSGGRTMGLMVPAALGAKNATPDRPMIGLGADGSLLMRLGELEAFARTGVAMPLVIINDRALGTMKSRQKSRGMPDYGLDLHDVGFAQVARACGLNGVTAETPEQLEKALKTAVRSDRTTLIDARVDPQAYQDGFGPTIGVMPTAN